MRSYQTQDGAMSPEVDSGNAAPLRNAILPADIVGLSEP